MKKIVFSIMLLCPIFVIASEADKDAGGCVAVVMWKEQNGKPVSKQLDAVRNKYSSSVESAMKKGGQLCSAPQGVSIDCLKNKLSPSEFDLYMGYIDARRYVRGPQDPSRLPNDETLTLAHCSTFMR